MNASVKAPNFTKNGSNSFLLMSLILVSKKALNFFFLRFGYGKFVNISMEPLIKVFLVL